MVDLSTFQLHRALKDYSTFRIGGHAQYLIEIRTIDLLQEVLRYCSKEKLPYIVVGKGSNSLFHDEGFQGLAIINRIDFFEEPKKGLFHVGAGYSFSLLGVKTARDGWSGLEFASGIPGSIGGAVFMNAGANGGETCNTLISVDYVDEQGNLHILSKSDLHFTYRHSSFQSMPGVIAGATFSLNLSSDARQKQIDIVNYRKKTQPLSELSIGCIFRNPNCGSAGALIEQCGLKGITIGDAKVSEIHANFIINQGAASSKDVLQLIQLVKEKVKKQTGIILESEMRLLGGVVS